MSEIDVSPISLIAAPTRRTSLWQMLPLGAMEAIFIPVVALTVSLIPFGIFVALAGANPFETVSLMYTGAFGTTFSWQNTLARAAPLMLTGLCVALPLRLGMVIIGGEGAVVLGGLAAAGVAHLMPNASPMSVLIAMIVSGMAVGGMWITIAAALRQFRGVNETISSLLLSYIAIAILNHMVEGPMHDPESLNNPSTWQIGDNNMLGSIPGLDVHWGLVFSVVACVFSYILMNHTILGFGARIVGGNMRAAKIVGISVWKLILFVSFLAGSFAGLAGVVEVAAIHGKANAALVAGYGYTGILVAFIARQNPLAIIPVSMLLGGIAASGGLLQRRQKLPDATVLVLQGILFVVLLAFETLYGRIAFFQKKEASNG